MKKLLISALLLLVGSLLFTSCQSAPQVNTSVPQDVNSRTTRTYSK